jgi:hypothetical protein
MAKATHPIPARLALAGALLLGLSDCQPDCAQEACEAAKAPYGRSAIDQGVAGVVAYRTDSCTNLCCECSDADTMLEIYPVTAPVTDAAGAQAIVAQGSAPIRFMANKRYERALDAGEYLLCTISRCAPLFVAANKVTTANVLLIYGPAKLYVSTADDRVPRDDRVFDVDAIEH